MYQFITGITFELVLIILFVMGYLSMAGRIKFGMQGDDFEEWRMKNGKIVRMICLMTIFVLLASVVSKYFQFFHTEALPTLNR